MKRIACLTALLALFVLPLDAAEPTIKDIMKRAHLGSTSLLPEIARHLKAEPTAWAEVQKQVKELNTLGVSLSKNTPPKGDKASWDKFTQAYLADVKALDDATQKMAKPTAQAALNKLNTSCKACHTEHQKK